MERLRELILDQRDRFPDFVYYLPLIDKAIDYRHSRPDTSIECCNSLIQGISKTVILNLDADATREDVDGRAEGRTDTLLKRALTLIQQHADVAEDGFVRRGVSLAKAIGELRNVRGDVSHGKAVPKLIESNAHLAVAANAVMDGILSYLLATFLIAAENLADERAAYVSLDYDQYPDFNDFLDEEYPPRGKVVHSRALYEFYPEDYRIQLGDFVATDEDGE